MDTWLVVLLVILALLVVGAIAPYLYMQRRRSKELRSRFGPEYERAVSERGRRDAEKELNQRAERVKRLHIRDLDPDERRLFAENWRSVQAHFVDEPAAAIGDADRLVQRVMDRRGYPTGSDFEQRSADISVDHPEVVTNYREAHAIAARHEREGVSTEELRQAMIHYRALFAELLGEVAAQR
jgi:hypothetical protein